MQSALLPGDAVLRVPRLAVSIPSRIKGTTWCGSARQGTIWKRARTRELYGKPFRKLLLFVCMRILCSCKDQLAIDRGMLPVWRFVRALSRLYSVISRTAGILGRVSQYEWVSVDAMLGFRPGCWSSLPVAGLQGSSFVTGLAVLQVGPCSMPWT